MGIVEAVFSFNRRYRPKAHARGAARFSRQMDRFMTRRARRGPVRAAVGDAGWRVLGAIAPVGKREDARLQQMAARNVDRGAGLMPERAPDNRAIREPRKRAPRHQRSRSRAA